MINAQRKEMDHLIFQWLTEERFKPQVQLMLVLYDLRMATFEQIQTITGWDEYKINNTFKRVKNGDLPCSMKNNKEEKELWLKTYAYLDKRKSVYYLGKKGLEYVNAILEENKKIKEQTSAQLHHNLGLVNIISRLIQSGVKEKEGVVWLSTQEALTDLLSQLSGSKKEFDEKRVIRPDGKLAFDDKVFWIEFDNNTEGSRQLERKLVYYVKTLSVIRDQTPIIWVTPYKSRTTYLRKIWETICRTYYPNGKYMVTAGVVVPIPKMYFFTEGEETKFILEYVKPTEMSLTPSSSARNRNFESQKTNQDSVDVEPKTEEVGFKEERFDDFFTEEEEYEVDDRPSEKEKNEEELDEEEEIETVKSVKKIEVETTHIPKPTEGYTPRTKPPVVFKNQKNV